MGALLRRRRVAVGLVFALAVTGGAPLAFAAANATRTLAVVVLRAAQVGPGYRASPLGQSTVHLGGGSFGCVQLPKGVSKGTRTFGRTYSKPGAPAVFNALIQFGSAEALAETMTALSRVLSRCPSLKQKVGTGLYASIQLTRPKAPHLLRGSIALREVISGSAGGHKYRGNTILGIYQADGKVLSLVFGGSTDVAATRAVVVHGAQESARNLRR
jgi:hypothetical protein